MIDVYIHLYIYDGIWIFLSVVHNRKDYLERTLNAILKFHPGESSLPVLISQDGNDSGVIGVVNSFKEKFENRFPNVVFTNVQHKQRYVLCFFVTLFFETIHDC